jgi:hypothetical protein
MKFLKAITATAFLGVSALSMSSPAVAGWGCGWGCGWGAALAGFGVGAMVGSALAPAYVGPPPPDYYYSYGPADYEDYYYGPPDYEPPYGPPPGPSSWHATRTPNSNRHHPRLLRRLQKQVASPARSKKTTLGSRRLKQKQNEPELTRSPKRTLMA